MPMFKVAFAINTLVPEQQEHLSIARICIACDSFDLVVLVGDGATPPPGAAAWNRRTGVAATKHIVRKSQAKSQTCYSACWTASQWMRLMRMGMHR